MIPDQNIKNKIPRFLLFVLLLSICCFVLLYKIDELPGEPYGDIIVAQEITDNLLHGNINIKYVLGDGPLFFYFVALIAKIIGLSYLSLKISSIIIGTLTILFTFLLTKKILGNSVGLFVLLIFPFSKSFLVFSRLGNMPIAVSLISISSVYLLYRFCKEGKFRFAILSFLIGFLGIFVYFPSWIASSVLLLIFLTSKQTKPNVSVVTNKIPFVFFLYFLSISFSFIYLYQERETFFTKDSYLMEKATVHNSQSAEIRKDWFTAFLTNTKKQYEMLFFENKGDPVFRYNPERKPYLDFLSRFAFLIGMISIIITNSKRKERLSFLLLPLILYQLPPSLDLNYGGPSSWRATGIMPFVYIFTAYGYFLTFKFIDSMLKRYLLKKKCYFSSLVAWAIIIVLVIFSDFFNLKQYFVDYPNNLPNKNVSFSGEIAKQIDNLSKNTIIYVIGSNWGDWGQPEQKGIIFSLKKDRQVNFVDNIDSLGLPCSKTGNNESYYFVIDPKKTEEVNKLKQCFPYGQENQIIIRGELVNLVYNF